MCNTYALIAEKYPKLGYEYQLLAVSQKIRPLYVLKSDDVRWYEIDDIRDLEAASKIVMESSMDFSN